jgi:hypothetical protein
MLVLFWPEYGHRGGSIFYRLSNDSGTLDRVVEEITAVNPDFCTFTPKFAVIVTWHNVEIQNNSYKVS